jgi:uncharacterized membrane protein YphA (DoxX/SURF4 family)
MPETKTIKIPRPLRIALRIILGLLFVVSAVAKVLDIDPFEMYVFSFGFLPLPTVGVLVRLCIAAELALGIVIATGWLPRLTRLLTLLMLLAYCIFLSYAALVGRMESCQCFGQLVDFDPIQSLLKNGVLIIWTLAAYQGVHHGPFFDSRLHTILSAVIAVVVTAALFIVSVPDSWMFGKSGNRYNPVVLAESIAPTGVLGQLKLNQGQHLVAFVTPGCPFCQLSRQKITSIAERNHLDTTQIVYVEPSDIGDSIFMRLTFGSRPLVVLLDDDSVVATYHYRNISERQVADVLQRK